MPPITAPKNNSRYYVWKRSDGHIGCTTYRPINYDAFNFTLLKEFDAWDAGVVAFIEKSRAAV